MISMGYVQFISKNLILTLHNPSNPNTYLVYIMFTTQVHKWLARWKLWVRHRSRPSWHGREWSIYSRNWWRRQSQVIKSLIQFQIQILPFSKRFPKVNKQINKLSSRHLRSPQGWNKLLSLWREKYIPT